MSSWGSSITTCPPIRITYMLRQAVKNTGNLTNLLTMSLASSMLYYDWNGFSFLKGKIYTQIRIDKVLIWCRHRGRIKEWNLLRKYPEKFGIMKNKVTCVIEKEPTENDLIWHEIYRKGGRGVFPSEQLEVSPVIPKQVGVYSIWYSDSLATLL